MYDTAITRIILDRFGEVLRDFMNHPTKGVLVLGGILLFIFWVTRK
jgi:hypothetical protein